jgi:hypothetical protein
MGRDIVQRDAQADKCRYMKRDRTPVGRGEAVSSAK